MKKKGEDYTPQVIKDRIIDDWITELLSDRTFYPKQMPGHKYELSLKNRYFEHRFKHGVKELEPASVSMFECKVMNNGRLSIIGTYETDRKFIRVNNLPGLIGEYYLHVGKLIKLYRQGADVVVLRLSAGEVFFAILNVNRDVFLRNCTKRM